LDSRTIVEVDILLNSVLVSFADGKVLLIGSAQLYDWAVPEQTLLARVVGESSAEVPWLSFWNRMPDLQEAK
jgi:hypothetical protein